MNTIKFVVFDFDGVFTDGKTYFDEKDTVTKYYDIKDGKAISLLKKNQILVGLISAFKTDHVTKWNNGLTYNLTDNSIDNQIANHLCFDLVSIGQGDKMKILNEWLEQHNINYGEVAYIGDDLNDVPVLKIVGFSACPGDAVKECKEIVDYVCKKNGGNGAVREFVDHILEKESDSHDIIKNIKRNAVTLLNNYDIKDVEYVANIIRNKNKCGNNIYCAGVGKSENIAKHCADLLKCIGIKCFTLNVQNALHGDVGTVKNNDVIMFFSKSGNTNELINLMNCMEHIDYVNMGVCCDDESLFENKCDINVKIPFLNEIGGGIDKIPIPTNSYMSQMFFCNILVSILKTDITMEEYKYNHPAGNIGHSMKKIKDSLIYDYPKYVLRGREKINLNTILIRMTDKKMGCCFFIDNNDKLIGILTDGDIRRYIINKKREYVEIIDLNKSFYCENDLEKYLNECRKSHFVPIVNDGVLLGVVDMTQR